MITPQVYCSHTEMRATESLVEHPRNYNTHPKEQVNLLAKIIRHQGWRNPITVSKRSGYIVKGHARLAAAKLLELENVPVDVQEYADEASEYADMIADNRIAELAEADQDALKTLLTDNVFDGFDIELTGFDDSMIGSFDVSTEDAPELPSGDKEPFQQVTYILHDSQKLDVERAMDLAREEGGATSDVNENSNGNLIHSICLDYLKAHGGS